MTKLHDIRKSQGLTLAEFGEKVGVKKSAVHDWEKGNVPLPLDRAVAIEKAFHVSGLVDEVIRRAKGAA